MGLIIERCLIRFLYGRLVDSMLATWGLSLLIIGIVTTIYGNTQQGVPTPLGGFSIGSYQSSYYTLFLAGMAIAMMALVYGVMRYTRLGLIARATMQNPAMAATLGVNPTRVYMSTFAVGAAVTGLAGGLLAPVSGITPGMGGAYVAKAFMTVVGGGAAMLSGTMSAASLFGAVNQVGAYFTTPVYGEVLVFTAAIVLIRLLPQGISGRFFKGNAVMPVSFRLVAQAVAVVHRDRCDRGDSQRDRAVRDDAADAVRGDGGAWRSALPSSGALAAFCRSARRLSSASAAMPTR